MRKLLLLLLWLTIAESLTAQQLGLRGWFAHGQTWLVWTNTLIANRTGYYDWDLATLTDTAMNWALTLWMTGASSYTNDVPAFTTASADLSIRRPQQFKPAPGTPFYWAALRLADGNILQSGSSTVDVGTLVTVSRLNLFKNPERLRLEVSLTPISMPPSITIIIQRPTGGQLPLSVIGPPGQTSTLETSTNLVNWSSLSIYRLVTNRLDLLIVFHPAEPQRFYRLRETAP
jgi:hypothetical protein